MNYELDLPQLRSIILGKETFYGSCSLSQIVSKEPKKYKNSLTMRSRIIEI